MTDTLDVEYSTPNLYASSVAIAVGDGTISVDGICIDQYAIGLFHVGTPTAAGRLFFYLSECFG